MTADPAPWWRQGIVYQVYPRSFADANGDGTGDIKGIQSKLPYLRDLGVDAIWINPWYASPLNDGGYDVEDYRRIDPRFGDVEAAEQFIAAAHEHGIRIIADFVPNHTSSEHVWFQAALAAGPGSPERERYWFHPGKGPDGDEPPNNWQAVFGGSAWERLPDGDWYLHLFDATQPDLNWNHPDVAAETLDVFRFWLDRGVDGFRIDVAHGLVKDPELPDIEGDSVQILSNSKQPNHPHWDRDAVHPINKTWRALLDQYDDRMMVAEAWVSVESLPKYLEPDEYHQSFNFDFLSCEWDAEQMRTTAARSIDAAASVGSTTTWVLSNHDVVRHPTRYGLPKGTNWRAWLLDGPHEILDADLGRRRARAAALLVLSLPGSVYMYMGDELGLPEVYDLPTEVLDDPVWEMSGHTSKGRDGCRVPMPWSIDGPSFGFGDAAPWLPQPALYGELSAAAQTGDPDSSLELHRAAIALRRELLGDDETITWLDLGADVIAFDRPGLRCVVNFGDPVPMPDGEVLLASGPVGAELPGDTAVWLAV